MTKNKVFKTIFREEVSLNFETLEIVQNEAKEMVYKLKDEDYLSVVEDEELKSFIYFIADNVGLNLPYLQDDLYIKGEMISTDTKDGFLPKFIQEIHTVFFYMIKQVVTDIAWLGFDAALENSEKGFIGDTTLLYSVVWVFKPYLISAFGCYRDEYTESLVDSIFCKTFQFLRKDIVILATMFLQESIKNK